MSKIGCVQAQASKILEDNLIAIQQYAAAAAQEGCRVVCFPECFLTGYVPDEVTQLAIERGSGPADRVSTIARETGVDLLVGFMERERDGFYITHGLFRADGDCGFYRKTHLGQRERRFFAEGDDLKVFTTTDGLRVGIQLCVETHHPQITQTLALRGAEVVFAPHAVPRVSGERKSIWGKYIPARSYDNRVYMACCNLWDREKFGGGCLVTGPRGEETASLYADEPGLLVCRVDRKLIASFRDPCVKRSGHFFPAFRRRELYE